MINNEVRINKSDTLEELRQSTNVISSRVGDLNDITNVAPTRSVSTFTDSDLFVLADEQLYFNLVPDLSIDDTDGYIILKDNPTIPVQWISGVELTQSNGFSGILVSATSDYIRLKDTTGTLDPALDLTDGTYPLDAENIEARIAEIHQVGVVTVYKDGVEIPQNASENGFRVANYVARVSLQNVTPINIQHFIQGKFAYQGTSLANATWKGTILDTSLTELKLKTTTGNFSSTVQIKVEDSSSTIAGAKHGDIELLDQRLGHAILLSEATDGSTYQVKAHTLVKSINDINEDLGDMALTGLSADNVSEAIRELRVELGDHTTLTTTATNAVDAINELEADLFNSEGPNKRTLSSLTTQDKTSIVDAINEHDSELGTITSAAMGTTASTVSGAIAEHDSELGTITSAAMGTTASTVSGAIAEHEAQIGNMVLTGLTATDLSAALRELRVELGDHTTLETTSTNAVGAINEVLEELGDHTTLTTEATNAIDAINEHETQIDDLYSRKIELSSGTEQDITSDLTVDGNVIFKNGTGTSIFKFEPGTTLDLSEVDDGVKVSLLLPGSSVGISTFGTAFISTDSSESLQGFQVDRNALVAPALVWDEDETNKDQRWKIRGLEDASEDVVTTDPIVTFYNANRLLDVGSGLDASWDSSSQHWDIAHADTSSQASVNNSGNTVIQDITLDTFGHITGINSTTINTYNGWNLYKDGVIVDFVNENNNVGFNSGGGISVSSSTDNTSSTITISHADTSSQASVNNSGNVVIQDITLDTYGHITGINSTTVDTYGSWSLGGTGITDGKRVNIRAQTGIGVNQFESGGQTYVDISHADTSTLNGSYGGNNNGIVIEDITVDANGHITAVGTRDLDGRYPQSGVTWTFDDVYAYSFFYRSDEKLKDNIETIKTPLDTIDQLRGVSYEWKDTGKKSIGVVAQEVENVLPELVEDTEEGKTVAYGQIVGLLIEGIKELREENKELRSMVKALTDINNK